MTESIEESPKAPKSRGRFFRVGLILSTFALLIGLALGLRFILWVQAVNQAVVSVKSGKLAEARNKAQEAINLTSWFSDSKSAGLSLALMEAVYACRRKFQQAEVFEHKLLDLDKQAYGEHSAPYAEDLWELALVSRKQQKYPQAKELYLKTLEVYKSCPGHEIEIARTQALFAWVLFKQGEIDEALRLCDESDQVLKTKFGDSNFERLVSVVERAFISRQAGNAKQMNADMDLAYKIATEPVDLEKSSAQSVVVLNLLAQMYVDAKENQKALKLFEIAERNCKAVVFGGSNNCFMADILEPHGELLAKLGRQEESRRLLQQAQEIRSLEF